MLTVKPIIVIFILFVPSLCDQPHPLPPIFIPQPPPPMPDMGSPEEFLKEINELRAKSAKENKIPNMYKLFWSDDLADAVETSKWRIDGHSDFSIDSYWNVTEAIVKLLSPLQGLIGCTSQYDPYFSHQWNLDCYVGLAGSNNLWLSNPGEAGSQCPPRFKGENGLCVPKDPSKHTFWGTEEGLLEDVNYMRRNCANNFGIPNMHQLTWNESLVEVLKSLDLNKVFDGPGFGTYPATSDLSWDGFGKNWRLTELPSFSAVVAAIDEVVYTKLFIPKAPIKKILIRGKEESTTVEELIHPLQTSIGCMRKEQNEYGAFTFHRVMCLLGNMGQWPADWKIDVNSTKIPGSECMDGYVNDDGLCSLPLPTTTSNPVPSVPKKPEVTGTPVKETAAMESEQEEEAESSSTIKFSYGLWIIYLFLSFF